MREFEVRFTVHAGNTEEDVPWTAQRMRDEIQSNLESLDIRVVRAEVEARPMQLIYCGACVGQNLEVVEADYIAGRSPDGGKTVSWVSLCETHKNDWNLGSDWIAPIYRLGERVE